MAARRDDLNAASSFFDYLGEIGVHLARYDDRGVSYMAEPIANLLAGWIGVDQDVIEQERQAMLAYVRSMH